VTPKLRARPWQDVLHALQTFGIEVLFETERNIMLIRGASKKSNLPKHFRVPVVIQEHLVSAFGVELDEYLRAIPVPSKALVS
jgi:hypothetical protein